MSDTGVPSPPKGIPQYIRDGINRQGPETLRMIAKYADKLADHKEQEMERELEKDAVEEPDEVPENWDQDEWEDVLEDVEAPSKATRTKKEIDGRLYYYFQWREGDSIKSEYIAPVSPSSN